MGERSRYQPSYDAARAERHYAEIMGRGDPPQSLTDAEIERGSAVMSRSPDPIPVRAWVRYDGTPCEVDGFTSTWTSRAAEVVWRTPKGDVHRAWVWRPAVRPRQLNSAERLGRRSPLR